MKVANRIKKQKDFQNVIHTGKYLRNKEYSVYYLKNDYKRIRIGVSIPTKTGNAVIRNKIKRQIKASLASFVDLSKNLDIVIIPRKGYSIDNFVQIKDSLKQLIESIGEYK